MKITKSKEAAIMHDIEAGVKANVTDDGLSDSFSSQGLGDLDEEETHNMSSIMNKSKISSSSELEKSSSESDTQVGQKESVIVFRLRLLVALTILCTAVGVTAAVYLLSSNSQQQLFEEQFAGAATKILNSFGMIVDNKFSAIGSLSLQSSQFVQSQPNVSWPQVTVDGFQERSFIARQLSGCVFTRLVNIVHEEDRAGWEAYAVKAGPEYIQEAREDIAKRGIDIQALLEGRDGNSDGNDLRRNLQGLSDNVAASALNFSTGVADQIYVMDEVFTPIVAPQNSGPYYVLWQESPTYGADLTNWDIQNFPAYTAYVQKVLESKQNVIGGMDAMPPGDTTYKGPGFTVHNSMLMSVANKGKLTYYDGSPFSTLFVPVYDDIDNARNVVSIIMAYFPWSAYFEDLLPPSSPAVDIVLENDCGAVHTYRLSGGAAPFYIGEGDLHDTSISGHGEHAYSASLNSTLVGLNQDVCAYTLNVYPTQSFKEEYVSNLPLVLAVVISAVFIFTGALFFALNWWVERRQNLVMNEAIKSTAIVSNLFPKEIRDKMMLEQQEKLSGKSRIQNFLSGDEEAGGGAQIADLFPECTVFFSDIAGFTAWSSTRDPSQVFILLQTVYQAFDSIAKRRGVFKVETIGDSYVAVCGLPKANKNHALVMSKFAQDCLLKFKTVVRGLESTLGPDTADLGVRIGLHSGPVTAGVLRGERSRFQLFGDTVNTAARMESTGCTDKIQISSKTALLLENAGKKNWVLPRHDDVRVKGKGILSTYWLSIASSRAHSTTSSGTASEFETYSFDNNDINQSQKARLVNWMTDLFLKHIVKIIARQDKAKAGKARPSELVYSLPPGKTSLDEVAEVIQLPSYDENATERALKRGPVSVPLDVKKQLRDVIDRISNMYQDNPFHNFDHSAHVTLAVDKFMSRIETPDLEHLSRDQIASNIHDYTHGITSDPITILAIIFSALVHDADHRGVGNGQLAKEEEMMAQIYENKSIAEQNSLDISWAILMEPQYKKLRACLFVDRAELLRFRQIVVQVVLATDIFDKELNGLRKSRWERAFSSGANGRQDDLRATIVIEHIIQASDVSHTMQHWHVYRKWNSKLFAEMRKAFKEGRMGADPATFWYNGELGFFDNYIIPLAKKLKDCNVFGVSSDECLNYALQNREEWEHRGEQIVASLLEEEEAEERKNKSGRTQVPHEARIMETLVEC